VILNSLILYKGAYMNLAEKLVATYLRLNGFFVLSQFTVFTGRQHNHIDLIGLRAANSEEIIGEHILPVDEKLFTSLAKLADKDVKASIISIAAEVRTNNIRNSPDQDHVSYVKRFVGDLDVYSLAFFDESSDIKINGDVIDIGMQYVGAWIIERIGEMESLPNLKKTGSWNLSEDFLGDFLALYKLKLLKIS
jgi:hypothetical protein